MYIVNFIIIKTQLQLFIMFYILPTVQHKILTAEKNFGEISLYEILTLINAHYKLHLF